MIAVAALITLLLSLGAYGFMDRRPDGRLEFFMFLLGKLSKILNNGYQ